MSKVQIGIARLTYQKDGSIRTANFEPTLNIDASALAHPLQFCTGRNIKDVQFIADQLFSAFFEKVASIELADREKYTIKSFVLHATNYDKAGLKEATIEFYFTEI